MHDLSIKKITLKSSLDRFIEKFKAHQCYFISTLKSSLDRFIDHNIDDLYPTDTSFKIQFG